MSVRKSERGLSNIEFLKVLMDLEKWCLLKSEKAPKKYRYIVNSQLVTNSANAYCFAKQGNSIYVTNKETRIMRENFFIQSYCSLQAFVSQLDVIYSICKSDFLTNNELEEASSYAYNGIILIKKIIKNDRERYKDYK